jgi:hypothetical protein
MPPRQGNVMDNMFQPVSSEDAQFFNKLLPEDYRTLKMMHEVQPDLVFPMGVLGLVQRLFKSKTLKIFDEEYMMRVKSKDRKGIRELLEWAISMRPTNEEE